MPDEITVHVTVEKAEDSSACGIIFPSVDVMRWFGRKGRIPVAVTINGYSYRSSLSPMGGCHVLPVNAEVRAGAGVSAADQVTVHLHEDTAPRAVEVPDDLANALSGAKLLEKFGAMSFTHQKEWVKAITEAKRPETRTKRIADCVEKVGTI